MNSLKLLALFFILAITMGAAHAHTSGSSFLNAREQDRLLVVEMDFDLRDLHQLLQLDANRDGAIAWGELRNSQFAIESLVLENTRFHANNHPCEIVQRDPVAIAEHGAGPYARLSLSLACQQGSELQIDYSQWFAFDPGHRALLEYTSRDGLRTQSILSQNAPHWRAQEPRAKRLQRFLLEGITHLITGYDHLAFLAVLLLALARRSPLQPPHSFTSLLRRALAVITAFTVAHSITLALAATGHLLLPSKPVEVAIAASVMIAALLNLWRNAGKHGWKLAFAFGLVHGLGFAGALAELTQEHIDLLALAAFNLGIETAQIAIAAAAIPLIWWLFGSIRRERIGIPLTSVAIAGVAAFWVVSRFAGP